MLVQYKQANKAIETQDKSATHDIIRKLLLLCGILSSLVYAIADIVCSITYEGYHYTSQTISELSAIGAPTREIWNSFMMIYTLLMVLFAWGIWQSARGSRAARIIAITIFSYVVIGIFWPPMHQRQVIASGGGTLTDTLHIVFTMVNVPLTIVTIAFGATIFGRGFKIYSVITILLMLVFGLITGMGASNLQADLPTPLMGIWERICVGANVVWLIVLAILFLQAKPKAKSWP